MAGKLYGDMYDDFFGTGSAKKTEKPGFSVSGAASGKSAQGTAKAKRPAAPSASSAIAATEKSVQEMQAYLQKKSAELTREMGRDGLLSEREVARAVEGSAAQQPRPQKPGYGSWDGVAAEVGGVVLGQQPFLESLVRAFRRPTVLGTKGERAKNVILIQGSAGSGKHTALGEMAAELCARGLISSGGIARMDLALYPGPAQEKLFLQDLYAALNAPGEIVAFDHYESCGPACRGMLCALAVDGRAPLSSRYVLQRGILVESGTALVSDAVSALTPRGKYLVFFSKNGLDKMAGSFGAPFTAAVGDVCTVADYPTETLAAIAAKQLNQLASQAKSRLQLVVSADEAVRDWAAAQYCRAAGVSAVVAAADKMYRGLAEYKLLKNPAAETPVMIAAGETGITLRFADGEPVGLETLLPVGYTGECAAVEAELDAVVGLADVKNYVHSLADNVAAQARRKAAGMPAAAVSMHMIFAGNPGTGKTTIARIVAKYLKAIGALRGGQLVEVTRADLVGRYVGHTAPLTNSVIQSALGGVLFIDEAYSLFRGNDDSFGLEAIDTLVKGMEDHRDDLVVVLAGYSKEMETFLTANSGLASRFPNKIEFSDYTAPELLAITHSIAKSKGYRLADGCDLPLSGYFARRQAEDAAKAGNGRLARNLLEKAMLNQARRLAADPAAPLDEILPGDFELND